jgi:hypothetical protein
MNYSVASLYDVGHRGYLFCKINLTKKIDLSLRYAATLFTEKEEISSGNDQIPHSHKQEVGFQIHIKLP